MVNVEADALVGPLLARRAAAAGVVYTLAYGDQPALVCELVEWARLSGFEVVCAGKGTKHLAAYHEVTPATVWEHYGLAPEQTAGLNPQMFCSFLDGTKSAVEMAAVANATGLVPQAGGLAFPPCGTGELAARLRPAADGGVLARGSTLEVVSSLHPDGSPVAGDLRWGVYVTFAAADRFVAGAFAAYGIATSRDGRVAALWRPSHLVGLELGVSVARAALARRGDGRARAPRSRRSRAAPSATCAQARSSTARAASTSTACCERLTRGRRHAADGPGARGAPPPRRRRAAPSWRSPTSISRRAGPPRGSHAQLAAELASGRSTHLIWSGAQPDGDPGRFECESVLRDSAPPATGANSSCRVRRHRQTAARILRHRARPRRRPRDALTLSGSHADSRPAHSPFAEDLAVPSAGGIRRGDPGSFCAGEKRLARARAGRAAPRRAGPRREAAAADARPARLPDQARRAVRTAHRDDGAHAARRRRP